MNIRKYIILRDLSHQEHPVVFSKAIEHCKMVPVGFGVVPISAGFFTLSKGVPIIPAIDSETLRLGPRPQDKDILTQFLS